MRPGRADANDAVPRSPLRLLILDPGDRFACLRAALQARRRDLQLVGVGHALRDVQAWTAWTWPDVVLLHWEDSPDSALAAELRESVPAPLVIAAVPEAAIDEARKALQALGCGVVRAARAPAQQIDEILRLAGVPPGPGRTGQPVPRRR